MDYQIQFDINWVQDRYLHKLDGKKLIDNKTFDLEKSNYFSNNYTKLNEVECEKHLVSEFIRTSRDHRIISQDENFILKIPNGGFLDDSSLIFDNVSYQVFKHQYLDSIYACSEWALQQKTLTVNNKYHIRGDVLLLNVAWGNVYSHFLYSVLGKLRNYLKFRPTLSEIDYIVVPEIQPFMQECFDLLNIPSQKLIGLPSSGTHHHPGNLITADNLIIPSAALPGNLNSADFIRKMALAGPIKSNNNSKKLYVSRINSASREGRHILNEELIYNTILKPNGFSYVIEENLLLTEKAELFNSAEIVITPAGSGSLSHASFLSAGATLIEIMHPHFVDFIAADVVQHMSGNYYYHVAETDGSPNIIINPEKMLKILSKFSI